MNKANFFWSGPPLQKRHIAAFNSYLQNDWDVTVWTYNDNLDVPYYIKVRNANEILDVSRLGTFTYDTCNVDEVPLSDLFRLHVMKHTQGWWFDSDCFCLRNYTDFQLLTYNRYLVSAWEFEGSINNAVLYFSNMELLDHLIQFIESEIEPVMAWGKLGPRGLTKFLNQVGLAYQALPSWSFYPLTWNEAKLGVDTQAFDRVQQLCKPALTYHYYNSICNHYSESEYNGYIGHLIKHYS